MNAKHTPGPWTQNKWGTIQVASGETLRLTGVSLTCGRVSDDDECHGNARLCAAAPELLEALRLMLIPVDALGNHGGTEWGYSSRHAQAARAAILKATGEAP